jgi:hypothetical protein
MDRNWLKGIERDRFNPIFSPAGMNFRKLMKSIEGFLSQLFHRLFILAFLPAN